MKHDVHIITVGTARQLLVPDSREYARAKGYSKHCASLSTIVLTRHEHGFSAPCHDGALHVYPTNARNRVGMLFRAYVLGVRVVRTVQKQGTCVISAQDPLEVGWLSWLIARACRVPFHVQVHGDYFSTNAWCEHSPLRYVRRFFALILLKQAVAIRVVSTRIKESLVARGVDASKVTVLPIRPELESFLAVARAYHSTVPTFLTLGRLAPEKNITRIIRACALVHGEYPLVRLRIVGEGSERKTLETLIHTLRLADVVTLVPWVNDVPSELTHADVFLLASHHEAYALTLIEALATGMPVITTDVGCVGDVVLDGMHGIVVREETDRGYADAMKRMILDDAFRRACGERGREMARSLGGETADTYRESWVTAISRAL